MLTVLTGVWLEKKTAKISKTSKLHQTAEDKKKSGELHDIKLFPDGQSILQDSN